MNGDHATQPAKRRKSGGKFDRLLPRYTGAEKRQERWKIARVDGVVYDKYAVSNLGRVRNLHTGRLIKFLWCTSAGYEMGDANGVYWRVNLYDYKGGKRCVFVHRLVAELYVGGRSEFRNIVHHKDNCGHNPRSNNLEWVSQGRNMREYYIWKRGQKALGFEEPAYDEPDFEDDYGMAHPEIVHPEFAGYSGDGSSEECPF